MHPSSSPILPLLALAALGSAAPAPRRLQPPYQAPLDIAPPAELPAVPQVDAWSAGINFEAIPGLSNGHYCHVPGSKQILSASEITLRPSRDGHDDFQASISGTMPVADTLPAATMTIAVSPADGGKEEPRSHTAPMSDFRNVIIRQRKHGYDASVMVNGLEPFRNLSPGEHTVRLHAVVPDGRTLFCIETDWKVDGAAHAASAAAAASAVDELGAWRGKRDRRGRKGRNGGKN